MPRAIGYSKGQTGRATTARRTRKPGPLPPLAPGEVGHLDLMDALHRVTDTGPVGGKLFAEDAEAGAAFVRKLLAGRRPSDLRGADRAAAWAAARGYRHPGAEA